MGTTVIIMGTLAVCTFLGSGMALSAAFQYFHDYKPTGKKKGGDNDGVGESLRERAKSIS
jgi:hypothetical protein